MFTDTQLAHELQQQGYRISDALRLQPDDIIELCLAMKRRNEHRVLNLERMTAREADVRLTEARDDGWVPQRIIRQGPEKPITYHLHKRSARALA